MDIGAWIGVAVFAGMFALILIGVPVFISMLAAALVGSLIVGGTNYTFQQFAAGPYYTTSNFSFAVVPLFILMSVLAADCGIAEAAYDTASKWMGRLKGGMLMATVMASAIFGAACGQFMASVAVFAKVAIPELDKYKYDRPLSMACIATSGTLSVLIPPSVPIIIFCILTDVSIGRALVAGIIPGILLAIILMASIYVTAIIKPNMMPTVETHVSWKERFYSLRLVGPVIFLILLIIGGMYTGIFPPTVGGAIGSAGVLIIALIRRVPGKRLGGSFYETVLVNAQIFPMIIAGFLFARFILLSGLSTEMMNVITSADLSPYLLMFIVILFYLFVGCMLEFLSMAIITLPIIFPLLTSVGFDPITVLIVIIMLSQIATITPPLGLAVFTIASIGRVKSEEVFKGIIPFFLICLAFTWVLVMFPQLTLWLPNLFYK